MLAVFFSILFNAIVLARQRTDKQLLNCFFDRRACLRYNRGTSPDYSREFVTKPLSATRDGCAEPRRREAYWRQYVDRLSGEPTRRQACRSSVSAVAVEVFVNIPG